MTIDLVEFYLKTHLVLIIFTWPLCYSDSHNQSIIGMHVALALHVGPSNQMFFFMVRRTADAKKPLPKAIQDNSSKLEKSLVYYATKTVAVTNCQ